MTKRGKMLFLKLSRYQNQKLQHTNIVEESDQFKNQYLNYFFGLFDEDHDLDEILLNSLSGLWLIRKGVSIGKASPFKDLESTVLWLQEFSFSQRLRLDPLYPSNGGPILHNSLTYRWHAVIPPASMDGPLFSLRRHRFETIDMADFGCPNLLVPLMRSFEENEPLLICGPTGSGKTTLLTSILKQNAIEDRVFIIESLQEIPLLSSKWVRLSERPPSIEGVGEITMEKLIKESLRLRPDRLIVGEIRGHEAKSFIEMLFTGSGGVLATLHAGSPEQALYRLAYLAGDGESNNDPSLIFIKNGITLCVAMMGRNPPHLVSVSRLTSNGWEHHKNINGTVS